MNFMIVVCFIGYSFCKFSLTDATRTFLTAYPFIRNLNDNGEVGSVSNRWGNRGVLYDILDDDELSAVLNDKKLEKLAKNRNFVVLLHGSLFNKTSVTALSKIKNVISILVCDDPNLSLDNLPKDYSPDFQTLQLGDWHSDQSEYEWNPKGDNLFDSPFTIPIAYVRQSTQNYLMRAARYNKLSGYKSSKRLFSFHAQMYLYGKRNSHYCFDKDRCTPLVGTSIYGLLGDNNFGPDKPFVLATAPLDARSEFLGLSQGATSSGSAIAALLGALRGVRRFLDTTSANGTYKTILFGLYTGTNYGNFGAKRFVCHALRSDSNYNMKNLAQIVSIGEVALNTGDLYIHSEQNPESIKFRDAVYDLSHACAAEFNDTNIRVEKGPTKGPFLNYPGIPPSPAGAFLEANQDVPTVHIATHNATFSSPFHGSRLDRFYNATHVCQTARLAKLALLKAVGYTDQEIQDNFDPATNDVDCGEIERILTCLVDKSECPLVRDVFRINGVVAGDVFAMENDAYDIDNDFVPIQAALLSLLLQNISGVASDNCGSVSDCHKAGERCSYQGQCVLTPVYFQDDYSPRLWFEYSEGGTFDNPGYFYEDNTCQNRLNDFRKGSSSAFSTTYRKVKHANGVNQLPPLTTTTPTHITTTSNTSLLSSDNSSSSSSSSSKSSSSSDLSSPFMSFLTTDIVSPAKKLTPAQRVFARLYRPIRTRLVRRQRKNAAREAHAKALKEAAAQVQQAQAPSSSSSYSKHQALPLSAAPSSSYETQNPLWMRSYADNISFYVYVTSPVYLDVLVLLLGIAVNVVVICGLLFLRYYYAKKLKVE